MRSAGQREKPSASSLRRALRSCIVVVDLDARQSPVWATSAPTSCSVITPTTSPQQYVVVLVPADGWSCSRTSPARVPTLPQDGVSLLRAARKPSRLAGRGILLETFTEARTAQHPYAAIRTERYRYELWSDGQEGLYDLKRDPWELQSRQADPALCAHQGDPRRRAGQAEDVRGQGLPGGRRRAASTGRSLIGLHSAQEKCSGSARRVAPAHRSGGRQLGPWRSRARDRSAPWARPASPWPRRAGASRPPATVARGRRQVLDPGALAEANRADVEVHGAEPDHSPSSSATRTSVSGDSVSCAAWRRPGRDPIRAAALRAL